jgi:hypothetical protein
MAERRALVAGLGDDIDPKQAEEFIYNRPPGKSERSSPRTPQPAPKAAEPPHFR